MQKSNELMLKIIKFFYGIDGNLDEYRLGQIRRIGNNAFIMLFIYTLASNIVVSFIGLASPQNTLTTFIFVNILFSLVVITGYIGVAMNKLKLNEMATTEEKYPEKVSKLKKRALRKSIQLSLYWFFVEIFLNWYFYGEPYNVQLSSLQIYIKAIFFGVFVALGLYIYWRTQLKKSLD